MLKWLHLLWTIIIPIKWRRDNVWTIVKMFLEQRNISTLASRCWIHSALRRETNWLCTDVWSTSLSSCKLCSRREDCGFVPGGGTITRKKGEKKGVEGENVRRDDRPSPPSPPSPQAVLPTATTQLRQRRYFSKCLGTLYRDTFARAATYVACIATVIKETYPFLPKERGNKLSRTTFPTVTSLLWLPPLFVSLFLSLHRISFGRPFAQADFILLPRPA